MAEPANYLMTRAEDLAEIILFLGPFLATMILSVFLERGPKSPLVRLSLLAIGSFLLVLATGAFRTGETARAALFMVPFLILPIAKSIAGTGSDHSRYRRLAALVFLQALIMQLVGDYWW